MGLGFLPVVLTLIPVMSGFFLSCIIDFAYYDGDNFYKIGM